MDNPELEKLLLDVKEIKRAVRKANPFLRDIMAIRTYSVLCLPLGILLLADCLATHFLVKAAGSFEAMPQPWKIVTLSVFGFVAVVGSMAKWIIVGRRAAEVRDGGSFLSVVEAMYGGRWFSLSVPLVLCMAVVSAYFVWSGHPWLVASTFAVFLGPFCNLVSQLVDRREYLYTGWYALVTGLASMFFVESAPFIWTAIVWAGVFFVFGASGLAANPSEKAVPRDAL
jgi:hypothetical protein